MTGGKKFCTTVDTLTQREPHSMLAAMFSGRHTVCKDSEKVSMYTDRQHLFFFFSFLITSIFAMVMFYICG